MRHHLLLGEKEGAEVMAWDVVPHARNELFQVHFRTVFVDHFALNKLFQVCGMVEDGGEGENIQCLIYVVPGIVAVEPAQEFEAT